MCRLRWPRGLTAKTLHLRRCYRLNATSPLDKLAASSAASHIALRQFEVIHGLSLRSRSRNASFCYRAWDAECRDIPRAPEESCFARRHRGSARRIGAERHVLSVAAPWVIELRLAAPSPRSSPPVPAPRRIRLRSAIPAHFPARNNRATFQTHPAQYLARVSPAAGQIVLEKKQSKVGCLACVPGVGAPQFEKCLTGSTNRSAIDSPRVPGRSADWSKRSRENRPS